VDGSFNRGGRDSSERSFLERAEKMFKFVEKFMSHCYFPVKTMEICKIEYQDSG